MITVYHTNDMHGRCGALDRLESLEKAGPCLLVDAGDALAGSNTAFRLHEPILDRMSRLGYQAMAMGNREFHYLRGVQHLRARQRTFPLLAANLVDLRGGPAFWQPALELQVGGVRVGLLGATPVQYPPGAFWERLFGFRFLAPEDCLPPLAAELAARNDLVLLLSHLGLAADRRLASRLSGVHLILGGHSHTLLTEPERVGRTQIVQAGSHGSFLGELRIDPGDPLRLAYRLIPGDPAGPSPRPRASEGGAFRQGPEKHPAARPR